MREKRNNLFIVLAWPFGAQRSNGLLFWYEEGGTTMYMYSDCSLIKQKDHVTFIAKAIAILERDEYIGKASCPPWWEKAICRKLKNCLFIPYYCCAHCLPHGMFNRMTDHKGIWKLSKLPSGSMEHAYIVDEGKVYWGVIKENDFAQLQHYSSVVILLPKEEIFPFSAVASLWEKHHIGFSTFPSERFFADLQDLLPKAYFLHYAENGESKIDIWGKDVESIFDIHDA